MIADYYLLGDLTMKYDSSVENAIPTERIMMKNEHKLFLLEGLSDIDYKLDVVDSKSVVIRCNNCGFPLNEQLKDKGSQRTIQCFVCRRERILNGILIGMTEDPVSYVFWNTNPCIL